MSAPINREKLMALLKWYRQEVGEQLIAVLVINSDGSIFEKLKGSTETDDTVIESVKSIIQLILRRIEEDYRLGSFGAGTFDTGDYRFIFCKAGPDHVLITLINPLSSLDNIFPFTYMVAEKVARIIDGRTVSPVIPKLFEDKNAQPIERKMDTFQKIKLHSTEYAYKLILGGDGGVGKTSMVHRFVENDFQTDYKSTIGTSIMKKECEFDGLSSKVRLIIWDLAGQAQFKRVRQTYLVNAEAGFLVYDITRRETFENISKWIEEILPSGKGSIKIVLVGNKSDLEDAREVSTLEGKQLAEEYGFSFIETSAKNGDCVNDAFKMLAFLLIKRFITTEELEKVIGFQLKKEPIDQQPLLVEKEVKQLENELDLLEKIYLDFWKGLVVKIREVVMQPPPFKEGMVYTYIINETWGGFELNFYHEDSYLNEKRFKELESKKGDIQEAFSLRSWYWTDKLEWIQNNNRNHHRIRYRFKNMGLEDKYHWDQLQVKMIDGMKCFVQVIAEYLEAL